MVTSRLSPSNDHVKLNVFCWTQMQWMVLDPCRSLPSYCRTFFDKLKNFNCSKTLFFVGKCFENNIELCKSKPDQQSLFLFSLSQLVQAQTVYGSRTSFQRIASLTEVQVKKRNLCCTSITQFIEQKQQTGTVRFHLQPISNLPNDDGRIMI